MYRELHGFREVAGLPTGSGGRVRGGLLYRSGTPQFLDLATARALLADTGIRSTIDLRLPHEAKREGRGPLDELGVPVHSRPFEITGLIAEDSAVAPMTGADPLVDTYLGYLGSNPATVVRAIADLTRPGVLPTLVHCTVGKDRTGVAIALALSAIGVEREAIVAEYTLGAGDIAASVERLRTMASYAAGVDVYPPDAWTADPDVLRRFLAAVDDRHDGVRGLLAAHGAGDEVVARLTDLLVEPGEEPMANVTETIVIPASPDAVWKIGGDVANVADWVPAIESSRMDGDVRHATFAGGGGEATERIVEHDDEARTYVYHYLTGPLPLSRYESRFTVREHADGAEVVWTADFVAGSREEEAALAEAISGIYGAALAELRARLS